MFLQVFEETTFLQTLAKRLSTHLLVTDTFLLQLKHLKHSDKIKNYDKKAQPQENFHFVSAGFCRGSGFCQYGRTMFSIMLFYFRHFFYLGIISFIFGNIRERISPLSANFTKWSNKHNQFVGKWPTNCLSVLDHFVGLVLKGLGGEKRYFFGMSCACAEYSIYPANYAPYSV